MGIDQDKILKLIRSNSKDRREAISIIARESKLKNDVMQYVLKNSGSNDDAVMIYHDGIVAFAKTVFTNHDFNLSGTLNGYIYGICRNLWLVKLRKEKTNPLKHAGIYDQNPPSTNEWESSYIDKERTQILKKILNQLKVNCRKVLMYWAGGYKMAEIAKILGYKTDAVVRKKKHECLKEVIRWLEDHPNVKEELKIK